MEGNNINIDEFFYFLPIGYRFVPTDEELILFYLKKKLLNEPLPINRFLEINIYQYHPQVLTGMQNLIREDGWYFFTPRDRKYRNGSRPNRAASDIGYWKATGKDKAIKVENELGIGYKRTLDFYDGNHENGFRSKWKMLEYRVHVQENIGPPPNNRKAGNNEDMKLDDCVLCKIYENTRPPDKNKNNNNDNTNNEGTIDYDDEGGPAENVASHDIDLQPQVQSGQSDANLTSHDIDQPQDQISIQPDQDDQSPLIGNSSSTYCAMPTSTTTVLMNSNFGDPAAYYDQSLLQCEALPYYSGPTFPYYSEPTNNFNNQPFYSTYNNIDYSTHILQTDQSFSSSSSLQEYYNYISKDDHEIISTNVEMLKLANQMLVVDSSSIPLPLNVREYEQSLKKVKEW